MKFDGSEYLVIVDYHSKMQKIQKMPTSQYNSAKTITVLKELYAEHGILEEIWSDNRPQFTCHLFAEFTKDWNIKQVHLHQGTPKVMDKQNLQSRLLITYYLCQVLWTGSLSLLAYRSTLVDSHSYLWSPAKILCQHALCTTVPQRIKHKDPMQ